MLREPLLMLMLEVIFDRSGLSFGICTLVGLVCSFWNFSDFEFSFGIRIVAFLVT